MCVTDITKKLSRNNSIKVLKQEKSRRLVLIDRKTYTTKCLNLLNIYSFIQLGHDPTKAIKEKMQRSISKIKKKITKQEYSRLYPRGLPPGKFYGTFKRKKKIALPTISLLNQLFLMLELHHISWLNTWQKSFLH